MAGVQYIGNPDFRGYLAYQASQGDSNAQNALNYVGNDYVGDGTDTGINVGALNEYNQAAPGAGTDAEMQGSARQYLMGAYSQFKNGIGSGSVLGASTGGSAAPNTDAADLAYLDESDNALRGQLDRTKTALANGVTQLDDTYNQTVNRTNQDKVNADAGFDNSRVEATKSKLSAVNSANTNARTLADSVRRVLGLASGVNSTAYKYAAPAAIAADATAKRSGINETFRKNNTQIDNAQSETSLKFERALEDLLAQRKQKESDLRAGILEQEQGVNQQLGQNALTRAQIKGTGYTGARAAIAPYTQAINDRQAAIDSLFEKFRTPYALKDTSSIAPTVATYDVSKTNVGGTPANQTTNSESTLSPYLLSLLQKKFQTA